MAYPIINGDPQLLKVQTKDNQLKEIHYRTEKHDHEIILKSKLILIIKKRNIKV